MYFSEILLKGKRRREGSNNQRSRWNCIYVYVSVSIDGYGKRIAYSFFVEDC